MTIADAIARAHGGSAHATNAECGGADVWLSLPKLISALRSCDGLELESQ